MPMTTSRPRLGEPTLFELVDGLALAASPRQLELTGLFHVAGAALVLFLAPSRWWLAMPMIAFAAISAWGLASQARRDGWRGDDGRGARTRLVAVVRALAAAAALVAALAFALGFFLGALGSSWIS
jgi:hypothetical protein